MGSLLQVFGPLTLLFALYLGTKFLNDWRKSVRQREDAEAAEEAQIKTQRVRADHADLN